MPMPGEEFQNQYQILFLVPKKEYCSLNDVVYRESANDWLTRIDFQEPKDPSHWIPGEKMVHFDVKTIVLAQKL